MADGNPLDLWRLQQQQACGDGDVRAFQHADHGNTPVDRHRTQGIDQIAAANGFDNMIDTAILRQLIDRLHPIPLQAVNAVIGP